MLLEVEKPRRLEYFIYPFKQYQTRLEETYTFSSICTFIAETETYTPGKCKPSVIFYCQLQNNFFRCERNYEHDTQNQRSNACMAF
jgi:hypothetical protein